MKQVAENPTPSPAAEGTEAAPHQAVELDTARAWPTEFRNWLSSPIIVLLGVGLFLTILSLQHFNAGLYTLASAGPLLTAIFATGCCFYATIRLQTQDALGARAWLATGVAMFCFALTLSVFWMQGQAILLAPAVPKAADFFRVLQQPLLWIALLTLLWPHLQVSPRSTLTRLFSDVLVIILAVLVITWIVLLEPIIQLRLSGAQTALLLFLPLSKIIHLFLALVLFALGRTRPALARSSAWMMVGLLLMVAGGLYQSFQVLYSDQQQTWWLSFYWTWSSIFIAAAALAYSEAPGEEGFGEEYVEKQQVREYGFDKSTHTAWRDYFLIVLPYLATLGVCILLIWFEYRQGRTEELGRLVPVLALLLAIVVRQAMTVRENVQLSRGLHQANAQLALVNSDLERNVEERTRHLATLHGITSTLNTSLDRRTVLRVTLEKTMMAVGASCGGIWLRVSGDDAVPPALTGVTPSKSTSGSTPQWSLVHSHGFNGDITLQNVLHDLAVAASEEGSTAALSPETRLLVQQGLAPAKETLITVPIRWQGTLMGVMGLMRGQGVFSFEDRALVESVALEAGTSLQNARLYNDARHRADRDSVTSLLNHRAAQENLNEMLRQARDNGGLFSIVMMDLNNFKFFNDAYGHPVGDDVLRTVARCLTEVCRSEDLLGRYGGDEFIALLPDTDENGARNVCRRIAASLDQHHFEAEPGSRIPINMAFGWASYPQDGASALDLLTRADTSLYDNKRSGGAIDLPEQAEVTTEVRDEMRRLRSRSSGGSFGVLDALVTAIDNKDHYTRRHSEEVTHMALLIARELNYSEEALRAVRISGLLHDVGKIAVPDDVLRHPGRLTDDQWEIMRQHPVFGALIVKDLPHLDEVLGGVRHHHERWDGKGYPDNLAGEKIPPLGRLLAVPDCYSAMTTDRPYRKGFTPQAALAEIEKSIGTQFDPTVANAFLRVMRRELASQFGGAGQRQDPSTFGEIDPAKLPTRSNTA